MPKGGAASCGRAQGLRMSSTIISKRPTRKKFRGTTQNKKFLLICAVSFETRPLEGWQSGRMRRTRNPVYGYTVSWVQIPPLPPLMHKPLIFKGFLLSAVVACHQLTHAVKEHLCALVNNGQYLLMSGMARPGLYNFAETNSFRSRSERNTEL